MLLPASFLSGDGFQCARSNRGYFRPVPVGARMPVRTPSMRPRVSKPVGMQATTNTNYATQGPFNAAPRVSKRAVGMHESAVTGSQQAVMLQWCGPKRVRKAPWGVSAARPRTVVTHPLLVGSFQCGPTVSSRGIMNLRDLSW